MSKVIARRDRFLFRAIVSTKAGQKLRESGAVSYTKMRELVLEKLTALGINAKQFGLHSLRSGGPLQLLMLEFRTGEHGRWRSENAKDGYVKYSLKDRLLVSQKLGL